MSRMQQVTLLTGLYAAQGLPYGFFTLALPVLLREAGWSLTSIGFLQFLALPWAIKFMWAPLMDHHGTRRGWLLGLQCAACGMALLLSQLNLTAGSVWLFAAVFGFNLIAATQDIVTDGLAVRLLNAKERGLANGIQVGAYRLGMVLGGIVAGPALAIFGHIIGNKGEEALNKARSNLEQARTIRDEAALMNGRLQAIQSVTSLANSTFSKISSQLRHAVRDLKGVIDTYGENYQMFSTESRETVFRSVKFAQLLKAMIVTPILDTDGNLVLATEKKVREIESTLA